MSTVQETPLEVYAVIVVDKPDDSWDDQSTNISVHRYPTEELAEDEAQKHREALDEVGTEWYKVEVQRMWVRDWQYDRADEDEYSEEMQQLRSQIADVFPGVNAFFDFS